jgi:hypothetical protein
MLPKKLYYLITKKSLTANRHFELAGVQWNYRFAKFSLSRKLNGYELPAISKQRNVGGNAKKPSKPKYYFKI